MYENNELIIKRVINGYSAELKNSSELNQEAVDGVFIFPALSELIGFVAITYSDLEEE